MVQVPNLFKMKLISFNKEVEEEKKKRVEENIKQINDEKEKE